jgi:hypothetical protein
MHVLFSWGTNDKTISRYDEFLLDICDRNKYSNISYTVMNTRDDTLEELTGVYLIGDGGYLKWRSMQCPVKHTSYPALCHWSRWLESVRKDIECTFGILKGRFRILKVPCLLKSKEEVDNLFFNCCALHNEIMRDTHLNKLWEARINWDQEAGHHDICDIDKKLFIKQRTTDQHNNDIYRKVMLRVTSKWDLGKFAP